MGVHLPVVLSLVLNHALSDPGRDEVRRHTHAETGKVESEVLAVLCGFGVGDVVGSGDVLGGWDVISEATVLVKGHDEESLIPLRGGAEGLVDALYEDLAVGRRARGMERLVGTAFGVDVREGGEGSRRGVFEELRLQLHVSEESTAGDGPGVKGGVSEELRGSVVDPGNVLFGELLEDGADGDGSVRKGGVVLSVAV